LAAAEQAFSEAIDVRRRLAGQEESNAEFHRLLANSVMNLGLLKLERGDTEPALTDLEAAQAIRKTHVARADNRKLLRDLAKGYYNLATLYAERESLATAVARLGSAIEIFEQLVHDEPDELEQQKALAICWRVRGDLETDPARRGTMYHKARKVLDKLVQESPTVLDYQHERASVSMNLGDVLLEQSDRTAALAEFEEARRLLERLLAKTPENPRYGRDLGVVLRVLGEQQQAAGNSELAKRYLQQSVVLFDVLIGNHPGEEEFERLRALAVEAQHKLTVKE
jgi:tetratricopeptide (TPR) repeat protein